jgi:hypothetical protein
MYLDPKDARYQEQVVGGVLTPFHNHFVYLEPNLSVEAILDIAERFLRKAYDAWKVGKVPELVNEPYRFQPNAKVPRIVACQAKAEMLGRHGHSRTVINGD